MDQRGEDASSFWSIPGQKVRISVTVSQPVINATGRRRWPGALAIIPLCRTFPKRPLKAGGGWETLQVNICNRGTYKLINSFESFVVISQLCYLHSFPSSLNPSLFPIFLFPPYTRLTHLVYPLLSSSACLNPPGSSGVRSGTTFLGNAPLTALASMLCSQ